MFQIFQDIGSVVSHHAMLIWTRIRLELRAHLKVSWPGYTTKNRRGRRCLHSCHLSVTFKVGAPEQQMMLLLGRSP
jgi:hypothetical protein